MDTSTDIVETAETVTAKLNPKTAVIVVAVAATAAGIAYVAYKLKKGKTVDAAVVVAE